MCRFETLLAARVGGGGSTAASAAQIAEKHATIFETIHPTVHQTEEKTIRCVWDKSQNAIVGPVGSRIGPTEWDQQSHPKNLVWETCVFVDVNIGRNFVNFNHDCENLKFEGEGNAGQR